MVILIIII